MPVINVLAWVEVFLFISLAEKLTHNARFESPPHLSVLRGQILCEMIIHFILYIPLN